MYGLCPEVQGISNQELVLTIVTICHWYQNFPSQIFSFISQCCIVWQKRLNPGLISVLLIFWIYPIFHFLPPRNLSSLWNQNHRVDWVSSNILPDDINFWSLSCHTWQSMLLVEMRTCYRTFVEFICYLCFISNLVYNILRNRLNLTLNWQDSQSP